MGFDLSPSLCGWCFAGRHGIPEAGAFELPPLGSDLGTLLALFEQHVSLLMERFDPSVIAYESPIMRKWDSLIDVRKIYSLGAFLEYLAIRGDLPVHEVDLRRVKTLMAGGASANKADVVKGALLIGIILPTKKVSGREDAADAVGVALEVLAVIDPLGAAPHLAKLQGNLL